MSKISEILPGGNPPSRVYLISYDLIKDKKYKKLIDEIKKYSPRCKPLESVWIIKSTQSCSQIFKNLSNFIDPDDKLLVLKLANSANWTETLKLSSKKWLKNTFAN